MKNIVLFLILLGIASPCFAKAHYANKKDMIKEAECIVVVNITDVEKAEKKGASWTYRQKVSATVEQCLKGDTKGNITIYGLENFICAQCRYKKGHFVLFLRKNNNLWVGSNWHLGIRPIKDDKVEWFKDDKAIFDMKEIPLDKVIDEINTIVKEQEKKNSNKTDALDRQIIGDMS